MSAICCPKCGYAGPDQRISVDAANIYIDGERVRVTGQRAAIFRTILAGNGRTVRFETITDKLWGHDPDGGPLDTKNHIGVQVFHIRAAHPALRRIIVTDWGIGYHIDTDALEIKT